jgi:kinesin family protein 18/19
MVSAVENATKQLREFDISDASDYANLDREAELLRSNAEREALSAVVDQDKAGEAAAVQLLLQAQFEMMTSIEDIMQLNATEAIQKGRLILMKMLEGCTDAVTNLVKPDGNLPTVPNLNLQSPIKSASPPKPRKRFSLVGMPAPRLSLTPSVQLAPVAAASPMKSSPRRRKVAAGRKSVSFTPKKTQAKATKRSVRWKDDEEDGPLTEFQKTPQKAAAESSEDIGSEAEPSEPALPRGISPIPRNIPRKVSPSFAISPAPGSAEPTLNIQKNGNRFKAGFLSKKSGSSPLGPPPSTSLPISDNEKSPLRDIDGSSFLNRASSEKPSRIAVRSPSGNFSSSPGSDTKDNWKTDKDEAMKINSAMRRISSSHVGVISGSNSLRVHRRRSPTSATYSSSPSENTMFTASQARRMVKSEREGEAKPSVLSPHNLPVMKHTGRRTTLGGDIRPRHASLSSRDALRLSAIAAPTVNHTPDFTSSGLR